ncbi:unnamed protein product [Acanthoscelides obtectus]|uniref:Uncharacterized protein n=1 Tax=Acanthoscelides obtectus TaxID=200917 RepID=A0A9P0P211_ACAOB|nr:unnamed protein product [Acanthoscelides obtectus]CAK1648697.1 hypothetical protein AOBTE_LOCUS15826 [Acanthoscelides obtectus]
MFSGPKLRNDNVKSYIKYKLVMSTFPYRNKLRVLELYLIVNSGELAFHFPVGRDKELAEMISDIKAFIKKLEFWEQSLIDSDTSHFRVLSEKISQSPLEPYDSKYHVEIVSNLKDKFKTRFKDFNEIAIVAQFVVSPIREIDIQQFATSVTQNFSEDIAATKMEKSFCCHGIIKYRKNALTYFDSDKLLMSTIETHQCVMSIA